MTFLKWFLSSPRRAGGSSKGDWSPFEAAPPEAGKSVSAETLAALSGCGLLPAAWGCGAAAPPSAFGRVAASPQTRQMRCWPSSERTTNPSSRRKRQGSLSPLRPPVLALCGLKIPSAGTHATPPPNRAHSGSHAETRRVIRVVGDDVLDSEIIDTIGPFQADQTVAVALAEGHRNAVSP